MNLAKEHNVTITENDHQWTRRWTTYYEWEGKQVASRHSERRQKFLCLNGPLGGEHKTLEDAGGTYVLFNRAYSRWGRITDVPKAVLVWKEMLR